MSPDLHIALSLAFTFGVPMALAIREVRLLRRERHGPGDGQGPARACPDRLRPPATDEPPLPPCLIPRDRRLTAARPGRPLEVA